MYNYLQSYICNLVIFEMTFLIFFFDLYNKNLLESLWEDVAIKHIIRAGHQNM